MKEVNNNKTFVFKDLVKASTLSKIVSQTFFQCLDRDTLTLEVCGDKEYNNIEEFLEHVEILRIRRLSFRFSQAFTLSKVMVEKSFPDLMQICLINCHIESIQNLNQISASKLKKISLNDNKITNINSIRKLLPQIEELNIDGNKIRNIQKLSEATGCIKRISIDFAEYDKPPNDSLTSLAKFKLESQARVFCNSIRRVKQSKVSIALYRKKINWVS